MAETLSDVVQQLRPHRKFITPTVRNLDTGETYAASEVPRRVPKPVSPRLLEQRRESEDSDSGGLGGAWRERWAATRRLEVGTAVCSPFLRLIPASVTPNQITMANHACNWLLLLLSCNAVGSDTASLYALVSAAAVNFLCMMLDCLDGMHARRTGQTSKLGELLDHYLDALHTPIVTGSAAIALRLPLWAVVGSCVLGVAVYNAQLIHYHYRRVFLETAGVEGQIGTSALLLLTAYVSTLEDPAHPARVWLPQLIGVASVLVMSRLVLFYVVRFEQLEMIKFFLFMLLQVAPAYLHLAGFIGVFPFALVVSFVSFRITGSYVLNSIVTRPYDGVDAATVYWLLAWFYGHIAMDQLPMNVFFSRLLPFTGDFFGGCSVQDMMPYAMCAHLAAKNVADVTRQLGRLRRMK